MNEFKIDLDMTPEQVNKLFTTPKKKARTTGQRTRNGMGVIIEQYKGHVLCALPENEHTPYVTWAWDDQGNTYWGHYFKTLSEAAADMEQRTRRWFI